MKNLKKRNNKSLSLSLTYLIFILFFAVACGSSEEDEYSYNPNPVDPAPPPEQFPTPPFAPPPGGGGGSPIDVVDPIADPIPGDLPVGTHIIAQATKHTSLYANQYWNANYFGTVESDLIIEHVYARSGDELVVNFGASIRSGEREGTFSQSCNNRSNAPLTVWVGNRPYILFPNIPLLNRATILEDGAVSIGTHPLHLKKNKPCIVVKNLTLRLIAK